MRFWGPKVGLLIVSILVLIRGGFDNHVSDAADAEAARPIGQFLTIAAPVDDVVFGRVNRVALELQARAIRENRKAVLVLEISPGTSQFHQVLGIAKFLTEEIPGVTTVAWVPKSVRGSHAVLALACQEIILDPDAELGDIGQGQPLDALERQFVLGLANRRHNRMISEALVLGMLDRSQELIWAQIQTGEKPNVVTESRVVLPAEFDRLLQSKVVMPRHETLKSPGVDGVFTGRKARTYNFLAQHTAESRDEVARLYRLPPEAMREGQATGNSVNAMIIRVQDGIDPVLEQFVHRQITRAVDQGVNLLIFEIDSPGGYLEESRILAMDIAHLEQQKVRTVAYIPKRALSGAAMIALGCDEIYLHPEAQFGDAGPIEMRKGGHFFHASEKILSSLEGHLQTLAELKHRPGGLLRAMANRRLNVYEATNRETGELSFLTEDELHGGNGQWVKGRRVAETGQNSFLTVNGRRAHDLRLAETPVTSFDELKQRLGLASVGSVPVSQATWVDTLIFVLNSPGVTGLLFMVGIFCIYLEAHFPTGFFGICSAVSFGIFFWSRWQATAGWLEVILFVIGAACLGLEIFVIPGFGVFGISGGLLVLASLVLASQTFVFPSSTGELTTTAQSLVTVGGAIIGTIVLGALSARLLPRMPLFDAMVLTPPGLSGTVGAPHLAPGALGVDATTGGTALERSHALVGKRGVSQTALRPAGKVMLDEELVDVVSEGEFLKAGTPVEVVSVTGTRVVVRQATG